MGLKAEKKKRKKEKKGWGERIEIKAGKLVMCGNHDTKTKGHRASDLG